MTLGDRVKTERSVRGWSQAELARRVSAIAHRTITQVAIHHIENRGNVSPRFLVELAQALEVSIPWLQHGKLPKSPKPAHATKQIDESKQAVTPIAHYVGAGDQVFLLDGDDSAVDYTPAPPGFERDRGAAVQVRGQSMRPLFEEGDLLFFRLRREPPRKPEDIPDRPVIVQVTDGPLYVKRLLPGTRRGRFHLLSINPLTPILQDQPVESFAIIEWIKPREL